MNEKLLEFMKKEVPSKKTKTEILKTKKEEIFQLYFSGYTAQQVVNYLKITYQLITSRQTICKFIKNLS